MEVEQTLVNCSDCGKEISVRAESCPHCGAPSHNAVSPNNGQTEQYAGYECLILSLFFGLTFAGILYFLIKWIFPGHENAAAAIASGSFAASMWGFLDRYDEVKGDFGWVWLIVHWALMVGVGLYGIKLIVSS